MTDCRLKSECAKSARASNTLFAANGLWPAAREVMALLPAPIFCGRSGIPTFLASERSRCLARGKPSIFKCHHPGKLGALRSTCESSYQRRTFGDWKEDATNQNQVHVKKRTNKLGSTAVDEPQAQSSNSRISNSHG